MDRRIIKSEVGVLNANIVEQRLSNGKYWAKNDFKNEALPISRKNHNFRDLVHP